MAFCAKCGAELGQGENFCRSCGVPVMGSPLSVAAPSLASPAGPQVAAASQAAMGAAAAMQYQSYAQRMCPRCSHQMIVVFRQPRAGWLIVLLGVLVCLIPFFGWILGPLMIIVGIAVWIVQKGKARYQCPGCNYST